MLLPPMMAAGMFLAGCTDKEEPKAVPEKGRMEDPAYIEALRKETDVKRAVMGKLAMIDREINAVKQGEAADKEELLADLAAKREAAVKEYEDVRKHATDLIRSRICQDLNKGAQPAKKN